MKTLSLKDQHTVHYTLSPRHEPTLVVPPGETILIETEDAFSGQIRNPRDRRDTEKIPWTNPLSGPVLVEGANKNDTLVVEILSIEPTLGREQRGYLHLGAIPVFPYFHFRRYWASRYRTELGSVPSEMEKCISARNSLCPMSP